MITINRVVLPLQRVELAEQLRGLANEGEARTDALSGIAGELIGDLMAAAIVGAILAAEGSDDPSVVRGAADLMDAIVKIVDEASDDDLLMDYGLAVVALYNKAHEPKCLAEYGIACAEPGHPGQ